MHPNVNKPKSLAGRTVSRPTFLSFYEIIVRFFSFFCQDANETGSNCGIIGFNLSKKKQKQTTTTTTTTQVSTASNTTSTAKKRTSYVFFIF